MPECPPGTHSLFDPCPGNCTEPVDEEAELFEELWSMEYRISGDKPRAKEFARDFLDRHAHVLAEKIRTAPFEIHLLQRHQRARAAGLIDPRCVGCGESRNNGRMHGYGAGFGGCV
ncbi:hypothetical protein AQJ23_44895 [Streptomyces antibioticus]|nr:hypothetical protein [Streptomyces antibioticus]KUN16535.1 hypothetical protein AQJ23_44895 [Streptomyces antibioticus]